MAIGAAFVGGGLGRAADAEAAERAVTPAQIAALLDLEVDADPNSGPNSGAGVAPAVEHAPRLVQLDRTRELDCLTQAVYFEARGETARGQQAVAQVVLNRVKAPGFPKSVCGVVYQGAAANRGCQFSFACDGSARRGREHAAWERARQVAARALNGAVMAEVGAATHFHTTAVSPNWTGMTRVAQVGLHVFYRPGARPALAAPHEAVAEKAVMTGLSAANVAAAPIQVAATLAAEVKPAEPKAPPAREPKAPAAQEIAAATQATAVPTAEF